MNREDLLHNAAKIQLLICDVDGVLSDGKVYHSNQGDEFKAFNIKDGLGITQLHAQGIAVAIITGRQSKIVEKRAKELGIKHVFQGKVDKRATFEQLLQQLNLESEQVAHIGDDLPDLALFNKSGLGFCVADAHPYLKLRADWITQNIGGEGAVREITDLILEAKGLLEEIYRNYE